MNDPIMDKTLLKYPNQPEGKNKLEIKIIFIFFLIFSLSTPGSR